MKKLFLAALPLLFGAQFSHADVTSADDVLVEQVGADAASQITFEPGRATLTSQEVSALNDLVAQARMNNDQIDEVKVFVWGDKIYPETATHKLTKDEKKIAQERLQNIKNYLKKDLKIRDVETFNMAREQREFQDLIHAGGSVARDMKNNTRTASGTTDTSTATAQNLSDWAKGNPSEALIFIYKE